MVVMEVGLIGKTADRTSLHPTVRFRDLEGSGDSVKSDADSIPALSFFGLFRRT